MGNCICVRDPHRTTSSWSGDDWGSFSSKHKKRIRAMAFDDDDDDREDLLGESRTMTSSFSGGSSSSYSYGKTEVKIRMTKKDLEDLMRRINLKGLTAEEVLATLITDGGDLLGHSDRLTHQRSWRPTLQSIPEVD